MAIALTIAKGALDIMTAVGRAMLGLVIIALYKFGIGLAAAAKEIGLRLNFSFATTATIFRDGVDVWGKCLSLAFLGLVAFILYVTIN